MNLENKAIVIIYTDKTTWIEKSDLGINKDYFLELARNDLDLNLVIKNLGFDIIKYTPNKMYEIIISALASLGNIVIMRDIKDKNSFNLFLPDSYTEYQKNILENIISQKYEITSINIFDSKSNKFSNIGNEILHLSSNYLKEYPEDFSTKKMS